MIFIKILVKGYLKNITENETLFFEEKGIRNKNKIIYNNDNVKFTIKYNSDELLLIREGNDFINTFIFNKKKSNSNYLLKENNYDIDMEVITMNIDILDSVIYVKYRIVDTGCIYEYKLEMSDIL